MGHQKPIFNERRLKLHFNRHFWILHFLGDPFFAISDPFLWVRSPFLWVTWPILWVTTIILWVTLNLLYIFLKNSKIYKKLLIRIFIFYHFFDFFNKYIIYYILKDDKNRKKRKITFWGGHSMATKNGPFLTKMATFFLCFFFDGSKNFIFSNFSIFF